MQDKIKEVADEKFSLNNRSEKEKTKIFITNTRAKRYRKEYSESDFENDLQPPKSKIKIDDNETIISHPKFETKLKNLVRADKMEDKILASSTPKLKPTQKPSKDVIQVPMAQQADRPENIKKEVKKPVKKVAFESKIQTDVASTSNSNFRLEPSSLEKLIDSSSEDKAKIKEINFKLDKKGFRTKFKKNPEENHSKLYNKY